MCFGIRISNLLHQNTLNIPIQNIKCPKTPKTHAQTSSSPQPLFVKLVSSLHKHAKPNLCDWLCISLGPYFGRSGSLLGPNAMKNWVLNWSLFHGSAAVIKRPRSFSRGTHGSIVMSAHAFLVFLGHLKFWVGLKCLDGTGSKFWFRNTCEKV